MHNPRISWHTVETLWMTRAGDIEVAPAEQVAVLLLGEDGTQQLARPSLRTGVEPPEEHEGYTYHDREHHVDQRVHLHPPTTRGTMTICEACGSNCPSHSTGFPASTRKAVAPLARSCAKIRSTSRRAATASVSPARASCSFQSRRSSPRCEIIRNMPIVVSPSSLLSRLFAASSGGRRHSQ